MTRLKTQNLLLVVDVFKRKGYIALNIELNGMEKQVMRYN